VGPWGSGKPVQPDLLIAWSVLGDDLVAAEHPFPEPGGHVQCVRAPVSEGLGISAPGWEQGSGFASHSVSLCSEALPLPACRPGPGAQSGGTEPLGCSALTRFQLCCGGGIGNEADLCSWGAGEMGFSSRSLQRGFPMCEVFPLSVLLGGTGKDLLAAWVKSISLSSVCFWSEKCEACAPARRKATL